MDALYLACRDPRCPRLAKLLALGVVAYALSPIDLIPDFLPVVGQLDDLLLVPLGVLLLRRMIPEAVFADARLEAGRREGRRGPAGIAGVLLVVTVWLIAGLATYGLWRLSSVSG